MLKRCFPGSKRACSLLPAYSVREKTIERRYRTYNDDGKSSRTPFPNVYLCSFAASGLLAASVSDSPPDTAIPTTNDNAKNGPLVIDSSTAVETSHNLESASVDDPIASKTVSYTPEDVTASEDATTEGDVTTKVVSLVDSPPPKKVMRYLDNLYKREEFQELQVSLKRFSDLNNPEILWRRARSEWEIIKLSGGKETVEELKATLDLVDRALQIDDNNSNAHRWKAIISNGYAEKLGLKPQFGNLETMKYHLNRALELDPQDSTACTLLGVWHMELQGLSWLQRKVAATFLGAVPQTSYEEALVFLLRAEEVAPKAWNRNLFLIAKVYLAVDDRINAKKFIEIVLDLPIVIDDDKVILEEAEKLYKKHFLVML